MNLGLLFKKPNVRTVVLVDVGAESVAGGYARYVEDELPKLVYSRRLPIESHKGEAREAAMLRALTVLGEALIKEGAPALARVSNSGHVDTILVSIDTPWQETRVRTENIERKEPFVFTKALVETVLERTRGAPEGKTLGNESIIGTILNGYETRSPYGKRARRASILVLTSFIEERVATSIVPLFERLYHSRHVLHMAKCSLRYQAMRAAFPHEVDALVLDISAVSISVVLIRRGFFTAVSEIPRAKGEWVGAVLAEFAELAKQYPLPRTIFLFAPEPEISELRASLDAANLGILWLSDNPPKIISVLPSHLTSLVSLAGDAKPDLSLQLMALYAQGRLTGE